MSKPKQKVQPLKLYETQFVGRLETIEQVQKLMESLDDLQPGAGWVIKCRQTRMDKPEKKPEQRQGRRMIG